ncbi:MAG: hypothetical protein WAL27_20770 [Cellulosimicrobium cellulans]
MTLTKKDQERYSRLAELEERPDGEGTPGESLRGAEAAAAGHQLLLAALGSEAAVKKAVGGRPGLGKKVAGSGESPTIRVRVTTAQRNHIATLRRQMKLKYDSDLVRLAVDEYVSKHLKQSA